MRRYQYQKQYDEECILLIELIEFSKWSINLELIILNFSMTNVLVIHKLLK